MMTMKGHCLMTTAILVGALALVAAAKIPVVLLDYDVVLAPKRSACDVVGIDNVAASLRLVEHLVAAGGAQDSLLPAAALLERGPQPDARCCARVAIAGLGWEPECVLTCELDDEKAIVYGARVDTIWLYWL